MFSAYNSPSGIAVMWALSVRRALGNIHDYERDEDAPPPAEADVGPDDLSVGIPGMAPMN